MTTLLTGATGFVGSAVLRCLVQAGHNVRVLVRPTSDRRNLSGLECEIVTGDLADPDSLKRAVRGCEALFHAAADYRLWVPDREQMNRFNVQGTVDLIQAAVAAGVSRIVYTSSVATLRLRDDGFPADEESHAELFDITGTYKQSKFLAEREVKRLVADAGAPVVIVKPAAPFGPGDVKPTPTGRVVVEAASGRMPAYVNTGLSVVHVDDVATGHLLSYEKGEVGESYILGGENRTLQWILETVAELTGQRPPRIRLPHWCVTPMAYISEGVTRFRGSGEPMITVDGVRMARKLMYFSIEKARRELGYSARPAIEALRDEIEWFYKNGYIQAKIKKQLT
ncbi:MAG TPA: hopanoid-associated sugar epimerase [Candidatus Binatia bacterium]|nr:hopanoid-associated sugar epimerase [Candidatus Binatia bacterium]